MTTDPTPETQKTTTAEAVLGMLSLKPMSGYEIRQVVAQSTGNFWSESYGQIYPTLKRLEAEGAVVAEGSRDAGTAGRASICYRLTDAGRQRLGEWLEVPARMQVPRNELLLKLFFGALSEPATMRAQVEARRAQCAADLARYTAMEAQMQIRHANNPGLPYWLFTLRYGMAEAQALLAWAEQTLAALDGMAAAADAHPSGRQPPPRQSSSRRREHAR